MEMDYAIYRFMPLVALISAFIIHKFFHKAFPDAYPDWSKYKEYTGDIAIKLLYIRLFTYLFCCILTAISVTSIGCFVESTPSILLTAFMVILVSLPFCSILLIILGISIEHKYAKKSYD